MRFRRGLKHTVLFAVLRHDASQGGPIWSQISGLRVFPTVEHAEREVARLSKLKPDTESTYGYVIVRLKASDVARVAASADEGSK